LISLASHVITGRSSAQAPEIRMFMIPVRFVSRSTKERLKTGAKRKKEALMNESMAATEVIVLYFIISFDPLIRNQYGFVCLYRNKYYLVKTV
jgi:hypothetical protein